MGLFSVNLTLVFAGLSPSAVGCAESDLSVRAILSGTHSTPLQSWYTKLQACSNNFPWLHARLGNHANTIRALLLPLAFSSSVPRRPLPRFVHTYSVEATTFPTSLALAQHKPHVDHGNHGHFCVDLQTFPFLLKRFSSTMTSPAR